MGIGEAIVGYLAGAAWAATSAGKAVAFAINAVVAVGTSLASQALQGRPDAGSRPGRSGNVRSGSMAHQVVYGESRKGGLIAYANGSGAQGNNKWLYMIVVFAAHEVEAFGQFYINGEAVSIETEDPNEIGNTDGRYADYAYFLFRNGSPTQLAIQDLIVRVDDPDNWGENHRLRGRAYVYARLRESPARFPSFIPTLTCNIKGKQNIYDPARTGNGNVESIGWSDNPALIAANILEDYVDIPRERIDMTALKAAADACDVLVDTKDGPQEKRYVAGGYIDLEGNPEDWLEPVIRCMAGAVVEHDGTYYIHAGVPVGLPSGSVLTITDDHLVGDIIRVTARSSLDRANVIKGIFVAPETYDAPTEYPVIRDDSTTKWDLQGQDGGAIQTEDGDDLIAEERQRNTEVAMEYDLEFVASHTQAQRCAKIALQTQLLDETVEVDVNLLAGLDVKPWDVVSLNSSALGITDYYRIVDHSLIVEATGARVKLILRKYADSIYDWDAATEEQPYDPDAGPVVHDAEGDKWYSGDGEPDATVDGDIGDRFVDKETGNVWRRTS